MTTQRVVFRKRYEVTTDYTCNCELVRYQNEDGNCYHPACEGVHVECGDIISGTPTDPEHCIGRTYFEVKP